MRLAFADRALNRLRRLPGNRTTAELASLRGKPAPPSASDLRAQADRCRRLLHRSVIEFYLPGVLDPSGVGYLQDANDDGKFVATTERFLSLQARQLWLFSTLAAEGIERETTLSAAHAGYQMIGRFYDELHGGYYCKVARNGDAVDVRKEICLNGFALYALAAYHRATDDRVPLEQAQRLFGILEEKAYDRRHGGYLELFERDWTAIEDPTVRGYWARGGTKTQNVHMHLLEALAELYRVRPDELVLLRLGELTWLIGSAFKHPRFNCNVTAWECDWRLRATRVNLRPNYGHDLEGVWLALDAARLLPWSESSLRNWAEAMAAYALEHGYDARHGGFYVSGRLGRRADDRRKEWWVQAEALVTMLELFRLTLDPGYYAVFASTLDFIERHLLAPSGGWWSMRREDGSPWPKATLGSEYQDGYHSGRALLRCERMLNELADR